MSKERDAEQLAHSPIPAEKPKKKRKHADDERQKSSKKKRKHDEVKQTETLGLTPVKSHKKDRHKNKVESTLPSPESPTSKARLQNEVLQDEAPASTRTNSLRPSVTPPPSQSKSVQEANTTSPFSSRRTSLLVPLPPISISTTNAISSLLAQHISPLLLTYHPSLKGIILSFSDPSISSEQPSDAEATAQSLPSSETEAGSHPFALAHSRDEHGVSFIWLTATLLLFSPRPGDILEGHINVASSGFVGLVSFNYFQVGIGRERIPKNWKWIEPEGAKTKKKVGKKTKLRDEDSEPQEPMEGSDADQAFETAPEDNVPSAADASAIEETGYFATDGSDEKITGPIKYRVIDTEMVPGHSADKWGLRIVGTLLDADEESALRESEKQKWEDRERRRKEAQRLGRRAQPISRPGDDRRRERIRQTADDDEDITMTGALDADEDGEIPSSVATKKKHRREY